VARAKSSYDISSRVRLLLPAFLLAARSRIFAVQDRRADPANPSPSFEVAVVRPADPGNIAAGQWSLPGGNTFRATGLSLEFLTAMAYNVDISQIKGAPAWFGSRYFDIAAKAEPGVVLNREALRPRLQRLLRERFQMTMHHLIAHAKGYILVIDKRGSKLAASRGDQPANFRVNVGPGKLQGKNWSMEFCALVLTSKLHAPVVDRTQLAGRYDLDVSYAELTEDSPLPPLPMAIRENLGLRLAPQTVPVDTIVIDQANQSPTEN
jgi:uncharacterized protein (TIGR03435 family)